MRRQRITIAAVCLGLALLVPGVTGFAQVADPTDGTAEPVAAAPEAPAVSMVTPVNQFPPYPIPFHRGNDPQTAYQGYYVSLLRFVPVLVLFFIWVAVSGWVDTDSVALNLKRETWNTAVFAGGMAGLLLIFIMPSYWLGMPVLLLSAGVPIGLYVTKRNQEVPENAKVLTQRHLTQVANRLLTRLGLSMSTGDGGPVTAGPPLQFVGKGVTGGVNDRSRAVESSHGYLAAKELVYDSILRRATDIHIEPQEKETAVRIRVDGQMIAGDSFDRETGSAVVNVFKVLAAMDITERRRSQDGGFGALLSGRPIDFRIATQGTRFGEKMSLRILDQSNAVADLKQLGFPKRLYERVTKLVNEPHGLILCCGPTGAGKSTTLYASLNTIDRYTRNVITVEDPVEYKIAGVNQIEINTKAGQSFGTALRSILRQDPDVVMVGEIRDGETAAIACQAANTGHMVFSTVHANDSVTALYRLLELGVEPFMVANSVTALIGQRLVRKLCTECRQAYRPDRSLVAKAGLPADKVSVFYRAADPPQSECSLCHGTGYYGRTGVFELFIVTDRIREMLRENAGATALKAEAHKEGMLLMREEGLRLVARGLTSVEELLRVVK